LKPTRLTPPPYILITYASRYPSIKKNGPKAVGFVT
jgi:hypothetical protein